MRLSQLLEGVPVRGEIPETEVTGLTSDSRKAGPGVVFFCLKGEKADGHDFAAQAAAAGCAAVVAEHSAGAGAPELLAENTHAAYALSCANFFGNPGRKLKLVGVTGTNGKTTTTSILKHILEACGHKSGLVGTIRNLSGGRVLPAHYTTPEPFELQGLLAEMVKDGCEYAVMEVSSHALAQRRVAGLHFLAGVFTNLTQDHLDFHKTMENYLKAKQMLFEVSEKGVVNADDPRAPVILREAPCPAVTYGLRGADYTAAEIDYRPDGIAYTLGGGAMAGEPLRVEARLPGEFSVYNTLAALACAAELGIPAKAAAAALASFPGVNGRIEVVPTGRDFTVILDYAHTPDGLEKILRAVRSFARGRVVALFGCGGDRDKTKRPQMGKIAAEGADYLVVTSDNPRTEDPDAIVRDILAGLEGTKTPYTVIVNRREAIEYALRNARKDDIVVLAGKGHEDYQVLKTGRIHFDEHEIVREILDEMRQDAPV